ncbi:MAG: hypothetical protein U0V49_07545 [Saprospiraceae bacterium]
MKNQIDLQLLVFSFLVLFMFSCCQGEDPCPACFKDIVRCKVNGKEWVSNCVSNDPLFGCKAVRCDYSYNQDKGLSLSAIDDSNNSGISLNQFSGFGGGILGGNSIQQRELKLSNYKLVGNCIRLDSLDFSYNNFFILDRIDTLKFIIEGRFNFRVYNLCGDTATVTDGYFKTKFIF